MSTLRDLAREALEELTKTQFRVVDGDPADPRELVLEVCTSCGDEFALGRATAKSGHLCARTRLIADLDAALRMGM